MRICILESDVPPDELQGKHGLYSDMIANWLAPVLPGANFTAIPCHEGIALPALDDFDGFIITGSRYSAYDAHDWITELKDFVRRAMEAGKPTFGICFGHQLMAEAMGGRVGPSDIGWTVGLADYQPNEAGAAVFGPDVIIASTFHRDQILSLPEIAMPLATSGHCTWPALGYGSNGLSVQFHPELKTEFVSDLLDFKEEIGLPPTVERHARESLAGTIALSGLAGAVRQIFTQPRA